MRPDKTSMGLYFSDNEMHFVCPWHGNEYDMKTGECVVGPQAQAEEVQDRAKGGGRLCRRLSARPKPRQACQLRNRAKAAAKPRRTPLRRAAGASRRAVANGGFGRCQAAGRRRSSAASPTASSTLSRAEALQALMAAACRGYAAQSRPASNSRRCRSSRFPRPTSW